MGDLVGFKSQARLVGEKRNEKVGAKRGDKRTSRRDEFVRGQQVLANAIFHWKNDAAADARAAVRFLMHHLATAFRADDGPLQPRPVGTSNEDRGGTDSRGGSLKSNT